MVIEEFTLADPEGARVEPAHDGDIQACGDILHFFRGQLHGLADGSKFAGQDFRMVGHQKQNRLDAPLAEAQENCLEVCRRSGIDIRLADIEVTRADLIPGKGQPRHRLGGIFAAAVRQGDGLRRGQPGVVGRNRLDDEAIVGASGKARLKVPLQVFKVDQVGG